MLIKRGYYHTPGGALRLRQDIVPARRPRPTTPADERAWIDRAERSRRLKIAGGAGLAGCVAVFIGHVLVPALTQIW